MLLMLRNQLRRKEEANVEERRNQLRRKEGHFSSSCTNGTLSNPIMIDDVYSIRKDKVGNVFSKFVGTQSGVKKEPFGLPSLL